MAGHLTTHALDTVLGRGAHGLKVRLNRLSPDPAPLAEAVLDAAGRATLLAEGLEAGTYELAFHVAEYHRAVGQPLAEPPFLDVVPIRFGVAAGETHYHVPLLLSPFSYSTYRGS